MRSPILVFLALVLFGLPRQSEAQFFAFGKNKVQYEDFGWKYIQSEHFDVYYYDSKNYYLAVFSAQTMEAAYKQIAEDFRHQIADRITVIIYDSHNDFAMTNVVSLPDESEGIGGVTELFKNRIAMPFRGDWSEFRRVLHHELVHAVINDMFYGGSIQALVSSNVQLVIPGWFNEGIAEYSALGFDTNTDFFLRDATLNNYMPPIIYLSGYLWYRGGQSMWNYIVEEYGREKIGEIFQQIKTSRSVEYGFRKALGLSLEELSERWLESLKKQYWPEINQRESLKEMATQITKRNRAGTYNTSPAISPQGDRIAMITNRRGYFDVAVVSAIDGQLIKTLIKGQDNVNFESLQILNPSLSWSPDGRKLALSSKSEGKDNLAIVDYSSGRINKIKLPDMDAIYSTSWSPDGKKIAFGASVGAQVDIFVYNIESQELLNVTDDIFTDAEPAWTADSRSIIFSSDRGRLLEVGKYRTDYNMLLHPDLDQRDLYKITIGNRRVERLTNTPGWSETQPAVTRDGRILFISDQNGIPNVYQLDERTRTVKPITDLLSGVLQMSISADGTKLIVNGYNGGYMDIFMIRNPFSRVKQVPLKPNLWAQRRAREPGYVRVPAVGYGHQMYQGVGNYLPLHPRDASVLLKPTIAEEPDKEEKAEEKKPSDVVDFRNYVFGEAFEESFDEDDEVDDVFNPTETLTEDGRYLPRNYKLKFTPDFSYLAAQIGNRPAGVGVGTPYGGLAQFLLSDIMGDYSMFFASDLQADLRNSFYIVGFSNTKNRLQQTYSYNHVAAPFQTFNFATNEFQLVRFRFYGFSADYSYALDKFTRIDFGTSLLTISRELQSIGGGLTGGTESSSQSFLYPKVTFTRDQTRPGFLTPSAGSRMALSVTGSPSAVTPLSMFGRKSNVSFISSFGDIRYYQPIGYGTQLAFRASGGASFGRNAQTFFLGGLDGWLNWQWTGNQIPLDQLVDLFLTVQAFPMRGYALNALYGTRYTLLNFEYRFPLFAAVLPGAIPFIPLYNVTMSAFTDVGAAWGVNQFDFNGNVVNDKSLDMRLSRPILDNNRNVIGRDGDILVGSGIGFRTILFGQFPLRWDIGWPYERETGFGRRIHYISLGIDF